MENEINKTEPTINASEKTLSLSYEIDKSKVIEKNLDEPVELSAKWVLEQIDMAKNEVLKNAKEEAEKAIRDQVLTDKASLITVFGVFASIVSFLTIEFQFLRTICSFEKLLGFTLVISSLLLSFNLALDYLVKSRTDAKTPKPNIIFGIFIIGLFIIGIYFVSLGNEEICKDSKIYDKYSDDFTNQQKEFNEKYLSNQNNKYTIIESRISNIEQQIKK